MIGDLIMSSLVKVNVRTAKKAAELCLASIEVKRQTIKDMEMEKFKNSWWSKTFRKNWTETEWEKGLYDSYKNFVPWTTIFGSQKETCKEIIRMCDVSSDGYILLDEDKAEIVSGWK
jgi:hypothetical protein